MLVWFVGGVVTVTNFSEMCNFIWSIADLLRGDYKQSEYGRVILPFTVLRRLDCVLKGTKDQVLREYEDLQRRGIKNVEPILTRITGYSFYNISKLDFESLLAAPNDIAFKDRKSTRLNSSHVKTSYAVFCLKKKSKK